MKRTTAILLGTLIASSAAFAQTEAVLSRNAVGYIKTDLEANKLYLISNPFVSMNEADDIVTNLFAAVPNSTAISVWDEASQSYVSYSKSARGSWSPNALTSRVDRSDAVFIRMPGSPATLYFMGEVPDSTSAPTTAQQRASGITMIGYPYPVETAFTNTPMAVTLPNSSTISIWDSESGGYVSYSKSARGAWDPAALTATVKPGQGFVVRSTTGGSFDTTKPYDWP